jgi:hypothetical protein
MAKRALSNLLFDADDHRYETTEAQTEHLADRSKGAVDWVDVRGRTTIVIEGQISGYIPDPAVDVVARPEPKRTTSGSAVLAARADERSSATR